MEIPLRTHLVFPFWLHQDYLFVLVAWPVHFSSTSVPNIYCTCAWVLPAFIHYIHQRDRTNNQVSIIFHSLNKTETLNYQTYNYIHNMLRLFDGRPNFSFIKNETKHVCYSGISIKRTLFLHQWCPLYRDSTVVINWYVRLTSRVAEQLKT